MSRLASTSAAPSTTEAAPDDVVRATLSSLGDGTIRIALPGSDYALEFALVGDPAGDSGGDLVRLRERVGRRVLGRIDARALRLHAASGGGRFVEPLSGAPRIVQGSVRAADRAGRRLLVDVAAPMWVTLLEEQSTDDFAVGDLVNCYLESGATFTVVG